jgi:hypothetical protein
MARTRNIKPGIAHAPSMLRVGRDARLLFILLWTVADDEGRLRGSAPGLAAQLFPVDSDAPMFIAAWLDALEAEGCIERYVVDDVEYLRIVHWHDHQYIRHPTPSGLPPSPNEKPRDSRKLRERSRAFRESTPNDLDGNGLSAIHAKLAEIAESEKSGEVTGDKVIETVDVLLQASAIDGNYATALRAAELKGRSIGLWAAKRAKKAAPPAASSGEAQTASPSLGELHGMRKAEGAGT